MTQKAYAEAKEWEYGVDGAVAPSAISGLVAKAAIQILSLDCFAFSRNDRGECLSPFMT
ncbi:MAG TPA: hypothetical protein PLE43_01575 [Alphaproteobacteria bacterium]|nr:hypothetical protein [Alphaproteobacteria bacterium]